MYQYININISITALGNSIKLRDVYNQQCRDFIINIFQHRKLHAYTYSKNKIKNIHAPMTQPNKMTITKQVKLPACLSLFTDILFL